LSASPSSTAGFRKGEENDREWWVLPQIWMNEFCAGFDATKVAKVLAERGMLKLGEGRHVAKKSQSKAARYGPTC